MKLIFSLIVLASLNLNADGENRVSPFLEARWGDEKNKIVVTFVNPSKKPLRFWHADNSWGDQCISMFVVGGRGEAEVRFRRQGDSAYSINFPHYFEVAPNARYSIIIDLTSKNWKRAHNVLDAKYQYILFEYESRSSKEAKEHNVLIGRISSSRLQPIQKNETSGKGE